MITVTEVKTKKQQREFLQFPLDLYKGNPNFVPPLYADEKQIFKKDYAYYETSEAVYYNAYRDGQMVGRISGILQKASNEIRKEKRVRFTRFDSINDPEVSDALFDAVEQWAIQKGMDTVCGPLGFSDLEREGLLIEGFDELSTYEEQYNAPYYQDLIENRGYTKEVDWIEKKIFSSKDDNGKFEKTAEMAMKKYNLHIAEFKSTKELFDRYEDKLFHLLDESYKELHGTVPITGAVRKMIVDNFKMLLTPQYINIVVNEQDELVCFGVVLPSIAKAVQKSQGHMTPATLWRILKVRNKPEILDLALIGVAPSYSNTGVAVVAFASLLKYLKKNHIAYMETNLELESNKNIQNIWKRFDSVQHKRRRCYVKKLTL